MIIFQTIWKISLRQKFALKIAYGTVTSGDISIQHVLSWRKKFPNQTEKKYMQIYGFSKRGGGWKWKFRNGVMRVWGGGRAKTVKRSRIVLKITWHCLQRKKIRRKICMKILAFFTTIFVAGFCKHLKEKKSFLGAADKFSDFTHFTPSHIHNRGKASKINEENFFLFSLDFFLPFAHFLNGNFTIFFPLLAAFL